MDRNQEAAWEDAIAKEDYIREAFGNPDDYLIEAYYDDCDALEAEGLQAPGFTEWKAQQSALRAQAEIAAASTSLPGVSNDDCPF